MPNEVKTERQTQSELTINEARLEGLVLKMSQA